MNKKLSINIILISMIFSLLSCSTIPSGVVAVSSFEKEKYLGKWYEIARFDFKFEKGLNNVTAEYSQLDNGKIMVLNKGYNYESGEWKQAIGKAKFVDNESIAKLKVSFFGPFYAGYNVIAIVSEYKYALVCGSSLKYLWILSREKTIPKNVKNDFLHKAKDSGFDVSKLMWIEHNK